MAAGIDRRSFLALPVLALVAPARALPIEVHDALGRVVRFAATPRRLVVLYPAMAETVFALGVVERVVGVGGGVQYPPAAAAKPSVGGRLGISAEAIASLKPDLIVVAAETGAAATLAEPMAAARIPMLILNYPRIAAIFRNLTLLGHVLDLEASAAAVVAGMQARIAAVGRAVRGVREPRVYLETDAAGAGTFQTVGPGHYADDALGLAGAHNAFTSVRAATQVTTESIALADPDRMIILTSDTTLTTAGVAARPGWGQLRAVRSGNVTVVPRGFILIPGPRQGQAIEILARAAHPGLVIDAP